MEDDGEQQIPGQQEQEAEEQANHDDLRRSADALVDVPQSKDHRRYEESESEIHRERKNVQGMQQKARSRVPSQIPAVIQRKAYQRRSVHVAGKK
jgi:hypothetical protein